MQIKVTHMSKDIKNGSMLRLKASIQQIQESNEKLKFYLKLLETQVRLIQSRFKV